MLEPGAPSPPSHAVFSTRLLSNRERRHPTEGGTFPLVIEPKAARDTDSLVRAIEAKSTEFRDAIYDYGAILIRGFDVRLESEFSRVICSIRGLRPMSGYFMMEGGRSLVGASQNVFHTNTLFKTGGSFAPPGRGFHSENYYTIDTPAFQSFWSKRSSWLGGETALVHFARAYAEVDEDIRSKIERDGVCTPAAWMVSHVAHAYGLPEEFIVKFFEKFGLPVVTVRGERFIVLEKPSAFRHPRTKQVVFSINVGGELPMLERPLRGLLGPHYNGYRWLLHRFIWMYPRLERLLVDLDALPRRVRHHPRLVLDQWLASVRRRRVDEEHRRSQHEIHRRFQEVTNRRLANKLPDSAVERLARAMWKHLSIFSWQRGDVMIWDNLQMLHAGMPGLGPRELGVMLCNPLAVVYPLGEGPAEVLLDDDYVSVDARLRSAASQMRSKSSDETSEGRRRAGGVAMAG